VADAPVLQPERRVATLPADIYRCLRGSACRAVACLIRVYAATWVGEFRCLLYKLSQIHHQHRSLIFANSAASVMRFSLRVDGWYFHEV
jgi:hypothetical protein